MDLGAGGQILCSRAIFDDARAIPRDDDLKGLDTVAWRNHGPYMFKGVDDPHEVCEVGELDHAPLSPPPAGKKSWPAGKGDEELGWRPAAGVVVPETNWKLLDRLGKEDGQGDGSQSFRGEFDEVWKAVNDGDKSYQVIKVCFKREQVPVLKPEARLLEDSPQVPPPQSRQGLRCNREGSPPVLSRDGVC